MELLGPGDRGAPLERQHRVAAARHGLQAEAAVLARRLRYVDRPPVHRVGRLLHQDPRPAAAHRPGQVVGHGRGHVRLGVGRVGVAVHGHHVELGRPPELVHRPEQPHEVRGDRRAWAAGGEHRPLGGVAGQQLAGAEPGEVELLGRVGERGRDPRRLDLVPGRVDLAPDRAAPGLVQPADLAVPRLEPVPERPRRPVAVAGRDVAAVLVADVPHGHGRVLAVTLRHAPGQIDGRLPVRRGARAVALPRAEREAPAVRGDRQDLGVGRDQPRRGRGRGRGQVDPDALLGQQVKHPVQPACGQPARRGLQLGPGEHPDRDQVHARLRHQPDVLGPGGLRPLLGVVVAAVRDAVEFAQDPAAARRAHSWTLPAARPERQNRCSDRNAMTSGITEISEPMTT